MPIIRADRARGRYFHVFFREADRSLGDPPMVRLKCRKCGWLKVDNKTYVLVQTGAYLAQRHHCDQCGGDEKSELAHFDIVEKDLRVTSRQDFDNTKDKSIFLPKADSHE